MSADPIRAVMPDVSRAMKNGDRRRMLRLLEPVVGERVAHRAVAELFHDESAIPTWTMLTRAQWACLWNAACGLTAAEAAVRFNREPNTIDAHRKEAMKRLGVRTQAGAVAVAYRRGVFDPMRPLEPVDW